MIIFLSIIAVCVIAYLSLDRFFRAGAYRGPANDHFDGKTFGNIGVDGRKDNTRFSKAFTWMLTRPKSDWVWRENTHSAMPKERIEGSELVVTLVNHATLLIQTEGFNILTDPIWSKRTSPLSWLGPKRYRAPGIAFDALPPIDAVLLSHNHYDHTDLATLRRILKKHTPKIVCALGNARYLEAHGVPGAADLDWWETLAVGKEILVRSVPAQHFSSRSLSDRNRTLWTGYVIETPHGNIYFAGDTGYGPFIGKIKERYGGFRLGLIPIGAYLPSFIMTHVHLSPEEAYRLAQELEVCTFVPMHYGTFRLADDGQDQPLADLKKAIEEHKGATNVVVLENGDSHDIPL